MWCVGCCLANGEHRYTVFDWEMDAAYYSAILRHAGATDDEIFIWEL